MFVSRQPYIIAEIGSVHDGSFGNACKLIEVAAAAGADVVKFQTHIAAAETLADAPMPPYFEGEPRYEYFLRTGFTAEQWMMLGRKCIEQGVRFLSSPFSLEAVDLLEQVGVDAYKIPSGEVTNVPLLERVASTRKPVLLSSGMSNWAELDHAVAILRSGGELTVMQCSSMYPCLPEMVGLNILAEMGHRYGCAVGFSDHTLGMSAAIAAVALGASVIEKHLTFSRLMYGSDAKHSMEPHDFRVFCTEIKAIGVMLGNPVDKNDLRPYEKMKGIFEKSVVAAMDIPANTILERKHLAFKKPGDGISAAHYRSLMGARVARAISKDHKFKKEDLL